MRADNVHLHDQASIKIEAGSQVSLKQKPKIVLTRVFVASFLAALLVPLIASALWADYNDDVASDAMSESCSLQQTQPGFRNQDHNGKTSSQ